METMNEETKDTQRAGDDPIPEIGTWVEVVGKRCEGFVVGVSHSSPSPTVAILAGDSIQFERAESLQWDPAPLPPGSRAARLRAAVIGIFEGFSPWSESPRASACDTTTIPAESEDEALVQQTEHYQPGLFVNVDGAPGAGIGVIISPPGPDGIVTIINYLSEVEKIDVNDLLSPEAGSFLERLAPRIAGIVADLIREYDALRERKDHGYRKPKGRRC